MKTFKILLAFCFIDTFLAISLWGISLLDPGLALMLFLALLIFLHGGPLLLWGTVIWDGYEPLLPPAGHPTHASSPWQVLLFPARVGEGEEGDGFEEFRHLGFTPGEGRLAALACAFGVRGDYLDGFNDDWGWPLGFEMIRDQLGAVVLLDLGLGMGMWAADWRWLAIFAFLWAASSLVALAYVAWVERYRMPKARMRMER